ncbi:hypothetical protein B0H14DRAFT_2952072 [Mycena olivaceomarginata]|nr:hypothetical protein B0H14DRAFT_2952072 [Mycena olivaceomarginata]
MPLFTNHHAVHINACHALCPEPLCPQFLPAPRQHGSNQGKYYVAVSCNMFSFSAFSLSYSTRQILDTGLAEAAAPPSANSLFAPTSSARRCSRASGSSKFTPAHGVSIQSTSTFTSVSTSITPSLLVLLSFVVLCPRPFPEHLARAQRI